MVVHGLSFWISGQMIYEWCLSYFGVQLIIATAAY